MKFRPLDSNTVEISGFGLKSGPNYKTLEDSYYQVGEHFQVEMPDGKVIYEITGIKYWHDPYDMFEAQAKYKEHYSGWRKMIDRIERELGRKRA